MSPRVYAVQTALGQLQAQHDKLAKRLATLERRALGPQAVYLTTQLTSTSWDNDAKTSANNGTLDLSALFGVPAGVKAVLISLTVYTVDADNAQDNVLIRPDNDGSSAAPVNLLLTNEGYQGTGAHWCPCDANGDIYFSTTVSAGDTANMWIEIWGYAI